MFEDAMNGKVSIQRFLYDEFERNDRRLATVRIQYEKLFTRWIIENDKFDGLDGESIPKDVQIEFAQLQSLLNHYYPGQYPHSFPGSDEEDDAA